jgi:hypothetical protein
LRVDLRIMVPVKTTKDQPVSKLKRKLRDSAADVEPLELPDREHEPTDVDDVPPLSRVPAGVRELDPADQAGAASSAAKLRRDGSGNGPHSPNPCTCRSESSPFARARSRPGCRRAWPSATGRPPEQEAAPATG